MVTLRITLVERPKNSDIESDINWMCRAIGLGRADCRSTSARLFERIIMESNHGRSIGGSELSKELGVSRGSVLNLLNRMLSSGVVKKDKGGYSLRSGNMLETVKDLEVDVQRVFHRLEEMAREIDKKIGVME